MFFLLKMYVCGIKNIDKEIEINFYKNNLSKNLDTSNSHVKAIYGCNGAGKTGIMYAVDIYKNTVLNQNYLSVCNNDGSLDCLINKNTQEFEITMVFACIAKDNSYKVYSHTLRIKKFDDGFKIAEEKLSELSGNNINNAQKYSVIYHIENGEIVGLHKNCEYFEELRMKTMNLLSTQSFECAAVRPLLNSKDKILDSVLSEAAINLVKFVLTIRVVLQGSDRFISGNFLEQINDLINLHTPQNIKQASSGNNQGKMLSCLNTQRVHKNNLESYKKHIGNMCSFLKIFNDDLVDIEIRKDENGDYYECEKILVYKDKRISENFESTGIKKLINLYSALSDLNRGSIVFIDEFDANIHDVLLVKLVDYIMQYSRGQFIFTTHNLAPMDVLKTANNSIDFLSSDSRLVSWTKNGHYTPASQYSKGLIKYSPFNIEAFSFLGVFGDEQK